MHYTINVYNFEKPGDWGEIEGASKIIFIDNDGKRNYRMEIDRDCRFIFDENDLFEFMSKYSEYSEHSYSIGKIYDYYPD